MKDNPVEETQTSNNSDSYYEKNPLRRQANDLNERSHKLYTLSNLIEKNPEIHQMICLMRELNQY